MKRFSIVLTLLACAILVISLFALSTSASVDYLGGTDFDLVPKDIRQRMDLTLLDSTPYLDMYLDEGTFPLNSGGFVNYYSAGADGTFELTSYRIKYVYVPNTDVVRGVEISLYGANNSIFIYEYNNSYIGYVDTDRGRFYLDDFSYSANYSVYDSNWYYTLLFITDFNPMLSGVLYFPANTRDYSVSVTNSFSFNGSVNYNGNTYSGDLSFYSPYTTSNGDPNRVVLYNGENRIFIPPSRAFEVTIDSLSVRDYVSFVLFASRSSTYDPSGAYFISDNFYYIKDSYWLGSSVPYTEVNFTSADKFFDGMVMVSAPFEGGTEYSLLYKPLDGTLDDAIVAFKYKASNGLVWDSQWTDPSLRTIKFGDSPQYIPPYFYEFLSSIFSDSSSGDENDNSYDLGWDDGYDKGFADGLDEGYIRGKYEEVSESFLGSIFSGIINALDNLTLFGDLSLLDVLKIICGACITILILKVFAGG